MMSASLAKKPRGASVARAALSATSSTTSAVLAATTLAVSCATSAAFAATPLVVSAASLAASLTASTASAAVSRAAAAALVAVFLALVAAFATLAFTESTPDALAVWALAAGFAAAVAFAAALGAAALGAAAFGAAAFAAALGAAALGAAAFGAAAFAAVLGAAALGATAFDAAVAALAAGALVADAVFAAAPEAFAVAAEAAAEVVFDAADLAAAGLDVDGDLAMRYPTLGLSGHGEARATINMIRYNSGVCSMSYSPVQIVARGARADTEAAASAIDADLQLEGATYSILEEDEDRGLWRIDAFPTTQDEEAAIALGLSRFQGLQVNVAPLADADWLAMSLSGLPPVTAGRFFVYGAHDQGRVPLNSVRYRTPRHNRRVLDCL